MENKKESWLDPVTVGDLKHFIAEDMGFFRGQEVVEKQDKEYGKYFIITGAVANYKDPTNYLFPEFGLVPTRIGEFGPLQGEWLDYGPRFSEFVIKDDFNKFIDGEKKLRERHAEANVVMPTEAYFDLVAMIASKNKGRKINGKTYMEDFEDRYNTFFTEEINKNYKKAEEFLEKERRLGEKVASKMMEKIK